MTSPLSFAVIGCGSRGRTYTRIARDLGHTITAVADPSPAALETMRAIAGQPAPREYADGESLLAGERLADIAVITTQDALHFPQAAAALKAGYHLLLEKPAAGSAGEVEALARLAADLDRLLVLCFVLRYTPFYQTLKREIDRGSIGRVISIQATEGVGPWHQAHSFIRGHWARSAESTPMIVAKCSHDTDLLAWLAGARATRVASFAENTHFHAGEAPEDAPERCTDGCPHLGACRYDAHRYLRDQRRWLEMIRPDAAELDDDAVIEWLHESDWGRCVYHCDQDTPDHQVVSVRFDNGVTADLTMTAFDTGRRIRVYGTEGILEGALHADDRGPWIERRPHEGPSERIHVEEPDAGGYAGHGGGDHGLIAALPDLLARGSTAGRDFVEGHRIAFAAARAAQEQRVISPAEG